MFTNLYWLIGWCLMPTHLNWLIVCLVFNANKFINFALQNRKYNGQSQLRFPRIEKITFWISTFLKKYRSAPINADFSLTYRNTMINRITMETVACLRSKYHLKQNLIPSWPWSFRHTCCISDFWCKTKYTNNKFFRINLAQWLQRKLKCAMLLTDDNGLHFKFTLLMTTECMIGPYFVLPVAFPISGAKQNTQTTNFVGHPDWHTWQYCRSLWFSARSVRRISKSLL
jgi:hypothetical protein